MQVILRQSLIASGGEHIEITATLPQGHTDAEAAWRNVAAALAGLAQGNGQGPAWTPDRRAPTPEPRDPTEERLDRANVVWTRPDLHGKTLKTAHRVAVAIHELTEARRTPNVDNITAKARTSRPPIYNIADPETPAGQYMAPYIVSQKIGREIVLDLTPKGRQLVSLIRAGKVPA